MGDYYKANEDGLEVANLSTTERDALTSPSKGLMIFNTTNNQPEYNSGTSGAPVWTAMQGGGGSSSIYFHAELTGQASATTGQLSKASDISSTANPSGKAITSSGDPGLNNGGTSGFVVPESGLSIDQITIKFAAAAVGTGTVGTPVVRIRFFRQNYSTRTQIGSDLDITISATGVGTFNNLGSDSFQTFTDTGVSIAVSQGDSIGWEFVNISGSNDGINAISRLLTIVKLA